MIEVLATGFSYTLYAIIYTAFYFKAEAIKYSLNQLQYICNELNDVNEMAIIKKYSFYGKCYTIFFTAFIIFGIFARALLPYLPLILDIVLPLNKPRSHRLLIKTEYFIDQQKYFYLLELHSNLAISISVISLVAIGTWILVYFQHACGIFKIVSYRIEHAMATNMLRDINLKKKNLIYKRMIDAIDMHRKAMKISIFLPSIANKWIFILIVIGIITVSLNLAQIVKALSSENILENLIIPLFSVIIQCACLFMGNYIGQTIIDHNNYIFVTIYNIQWYIAPLHLQRFIMFILQRNAKSFHISIGGVFTASLEGFAMMSSAAISYFTFIYSTRF